MASADLPFGNEGTFNGATEVEIVAAPAADKQRIVPVNGIAIYQGDTVAHDITISKKKGSTLYPLRKWSGLASGAAPVVVEVPSTLDDTDESIVGTLEGAHTTTAPVWTVSGVETS